MSSTRNKNTSIDYKQQEILNKHHVRHNLYENSAYGRPTSDFIPSVGYMPSHMSRDSLANNAVDIESSLYGIGATNLVSPCQIVNPRIKNIEFKDFFERQKEIIMPHPMVYNNNQRPFPI